MSELDPRRLDRMATSATGKGSHHVELERNTGLPKPAQAVYGLMVFGAAKQAEARPYGQ